MRKIEEKNNPLITIVTIGVVAVLTGVVAASGYAEMQLPPLLPSVVIMLVMISWKIVDSIVTKLKNRRSDDRE